MLTKFDKRHNIQYHENTTQNSQILQKQNAKRLSRIIFFVQFAFCNKIKYTICTKNYVYNPGKP